MNARSRLWAQRSHSVGSVVLSGPSTVQHQTTNCMITTARGYFKNLVEQNAMESPVPTDRIRPLALTTLPDTAPLMPCHVSERIKQRGFGVDSLTFQRVKVLWQAKLEQIVDRSSSLDL